MKATHNKASQPDKVEWKFPCLGHMPINGQIVLFTGKNEKGNGVGICLEIGETCNIFGELLNNWVLSEFELLPSTESVTLQND
jgi:hypothetical protein